MWTLKKVARARLWYLQLFCKYLPGGKKVKVYSNFADFLGGGEGEELVSILLHGALTWWAGVGRFSMGELGAE